MSPPGRISGRMPGRMSGRILGRIYRDYALAFSFLTRFPTPFPDSAKGVALARAAWVFPLTGAVVAVLASGAGALLLFFGAPPLPAVTLTLLAVILMTGALHEDGLADTADGLGGGATVARKLEIMRDPGVGTYGVIAVCFSLILRIALLTALSEKGLSLMIPLALALMFSRSAMLAAMSSPGTLPAGGKGLGAAAGVAHPWHVVPWLVFFAVCNFLFANLSFILVLSVIPPVGLFLYAKTKLGGLNGDLYGAIEQVAQVSFLTCLLWYWG